MSGPPRRTDLEPPGGADGSRADQVAGWMERYGAGLRKYFMRRAPPEDVEDLIQEVFLRMQSRAGAEPVADVERYLVRIARNVLVSRHRHDRIDGLWRHDTLEAAEAVADHFSPERVLAGKQDVERAIITILNLPPRTRAAFIFHRLEMMSYSAIAKRMGVSKGAVQDLMQRAIDRLADEFGDDT